LHQQLNGVLAEEVRAGHEFVVVINEAQNLWRAALEKVRLLTNFETPQSKLTPQVINTLCFNSLSLCCALKRKQVDGSMVAKVLADQQLIRQSAKIFTTAIAVVADPPSEPELWR
jgi:type II secretory pathway predicted ATPase ExeA